jgi:hypothetical protein
LPPPEFVDEETNPAGAIVIFQLEGGLVLALYPRSELAKDADIPSDHRRRASSALDSSSRAEPTSMRCWHASRQNLGSAARVRQVAPRSHGTAKRGESRRLPRGENAHHYAQTRMNRPPPW